MPMRPLTMPMCPLTMPMCPLTMPMRPLTIDIGVKTNVETLHVTSLLCRKSERRSLNQGHFQSKTGNEMNEVMSQSIFA